MVKQLSISWRNDSASEFSKNQVNNADKGILKLLKQLQTHRYKSHSYLTKLRTRFIQEARSSFSSEDSISYRKSESEASERSDLSGESWDQSIKSFGFSKHNSLYEPQLAKDLRRQYVFDEEL